MKAQETKYFYSAVSQIIISKKDMNFNSEYQDFAFSSCWGSIAKKRMGELEE